jgi:16S rRNA (cytosine967-C5)-methyltransferase
MVNAVLRKISAEKVLLLKTDGNTDLAIRYSHPDWLVERLLREHDPDFVRSFLESNQEIPELCLQINTLRTTPEAFSALLRQKGIAPLSVRVDFPSVTIPSRRVDMLPGYEEGLFFVQDNAARASVKIIGLKSGMRVLDACAAPGGKSMAAALEGADVLSCDVNISRLNRCTENYRRLGMDISTRQMDASTFCTDWSEAFDVVIADVPCSGTGVIRRHPEIRQRSIREVEDLCKMQTIILDNLARYVRPGGTLLYSTCSVLQDEDEEQVTAFLERYPSFSPVPVELKGFDCENGMLRSWPQRSGNDGFFAARLVKKND